MKVLIEKTEKRKSEFHAVERKGIGHPDTIADMIADEFNRLYLEYCLTEYGVPLNHHVDKLVVAGAASETWIGGFKILKPITVHLFGKITELFEGKNVPIYDLTRQATTNILPIVTRRPTIMEWCRFSVENGAGIQPDHSVEFYRPRRRRESIDFGMERLANDTVVAVGSYKKEGLGASICDLENYVTGCFDDLDLHDGHFGTDVKVLAIAYNDVLDLTLCIPIHPEAVSNVGEYKELINLAQNNIQRFVHDHIGFTDFRNIVVSINTKDKENSIYIAPFGTALGKGDCGAVGRGNRINGFINYSQPMSIEAAAGKNPLNHVGKIYQILAQHIAESAVKLLSCNYCKVTLATQNGRALTDPSLLHIEFESKESVVEADIEHLAKSYLNQSDILWHRILEGTVIERYKTGTCSALFPLPK